MQKPKRSTLSDSAAESAHSLHPNPTKKLKPSSQSATAPVASVDDFLRASMGDLGPKLAVTAITERIKIDLSSSAIDALVQFNVLAQPTIRMLQDAELLKKSASFDTITTEVLERLLKAGNLRLRSLLDNAAQTRSGLALINFAFTSMHFSLCITLIVFRLLGRDTADIDSTKKSFKCVVFLLLLRHLADTLKEHGVSTTVHFFQLSVKNWKLARVLGVSRCPMTYSPYHQLGT